MAKRINRRKFLKTFGTGAAILIGAACAPAATPTPAPQPTAAPKPAATTAPAPAPTAAPKPAATTAPAPTTAPAAAPAATTAPAAAAKPAAQGARLVVAVNQWGSETPFAWMQAANDKVLWDHVYDFMLRRDTKTFGIQPGLATSWDHSPDYKTWTFKLRQGVMFHENYGELTSEDVKFTIEQIMKDGTTGNTAPFFKSNLAKIEAPDKYTVVFQLKNPVGDEILSRLGQNFTQGITSKKYLEAVGEDKARLKPIGTGSYRYVEGKQGAEHRFEAVPNHWRQTAGFKELVIRRIIDQATVLAGLRAGEIDIALVTGDFLSQAKKAGMRIHEVPAASQYWVVLPGQTAPNWPDYSPKSPWVGDPADPKSLENAKKVRQALNLAVNKQAVIDNLWQGYGDTKPYVQYFFPIHPGYSPEWTVFPYDLAKAKQLLTEAGYPNGFEIKMNSASPAPDGPDIMEAVALDWEKAGLKVTRGKEDWGSFMPKQRNRNIGQAFVFGTPTFPAEPVESWATTMQTKGTFYISGESPAYDEKIQAVLAELDPAKRAKQHTEFGQMLFNDARVVRLGTKTLTWALSKKIGEWPSLVSTTMENNLEYVTWSGQ